MLPKSLVFGAVFEAGAQFDVVMVPLPCHSSSVSLTTRSVFIVSMAQWPLEDLVCDSGYVFHASPFSVSVAVLAAIIVGVCVCVWFCLGNVLVAKNGASCVFSSSWSLR